MAQHDGKPYQPRRGPERPPQPAEDPAAPADAVDHLAMVAAEAEAMVAAEAEAEAMNAYEEEHDPEIEMEEDELEEEEEEEEEEEMEEEEEGEAEGEGHHEHQHHGGNGEALPMDAEAAAAAEAASAGAPLDPHGGMGSGTVHPASTNQLTLSFQGEVYVFDSVSPDKVQAVLLLLGGRELNPGIGGASSSTPYSKRLNYPHRVASLMRFREKRKERNFDKKIRYTVRKEVALRMQRKRGQFTSSKPKPDEISELATPDGSPNWASLEGRPPSSAECHHCGINAKSTPMMRRGPDGPRTLCNACGLMWANKGMLRDLAKSSPTPLQVVASAPNNGQNGNAAVVPYGNAEPDNPTAPPANGHESST
uniref:Uncharacterized protein n=1 Tax=Avena sativa TaxID=4498 RepID=A0ACD5ZE33_AVESA